MPLLDGKEIDIFFVSNFYIYIITAIQMIAIKLMKMLFLDKKLFRLGSNKFLFEIMDLVMS